MSEEVLQFWRHAQTALETARRNLDIDPATVVNRSYYAAFYAVSALFSAEDKTHKKHSAVEAAVHRDLVKTGRWTQDLGIAFSQLNRLRMAADYDVSMFPSTEEAEEAIGQATMIVEAVREDCPGLDRAGPPDASV